MIKKIVFSIGILGIASCNFLDVQPEQKGTLEQVFSNVNTARNFLYSCYSFMPVSSDFNGEPNFWGTSDEVCMTAEWADTWHYSKKVNLGTQTAADPIYNYWSHFTSTTQPSRCKAYNLYGAIRQCYIFLNRIRSVPKISDLDVKQWSAEARFLIAYYHYNLLRLYGPIVIADRELPLDAPDELAFPKRLPYDQCVNWIASALDAAAADLPTGYPSNDYGKPTSVTAKAIKARMLLYAASPLFNGNSEFYANFKNKDGEHLINQTYDAEKWKRALDATKEAIDLAHANGYALFEVPGSIAPSNTPDSVKAYYNARFMVVMMPSEGNTDLIWAYTKDRMNSQQMFAIRGLSAGSTSIPYGGVSPTFSMVETYYTKRGLPMDKDPGFDYANRYALAQIPGTPDTTVRMHLNREPRFYANIAYDRARNYELDGNYDINGKPSFTLYLRMGEQNPATGLPSSNDVNRGNCIPNGYAWKKFLHPRTGFINNAITLKAVAFPLIRLTELYLNYAEAYYEYYGTLSGDALTYFNLIRRRAGIPDVDVAWNGIPGKDYREIIRQERTIELMLEGHRYFDVRRWKIAHLNGSIAKRQKRWNCFAEGFSYAKKQSASNYLSLFNSAEPAKVFEIKHYLYPLDSRDVDLNKKLVNNPGW